MPSSGYSITPPATKSVEIKDTRGAVGTENPLPSTAYDGGGNALESEDLLRELLALGAKILFHLELLTDATAPVSTPEDGPSL